MIHTLTLHPAIDRAVTLAQSLRVGGTQRATGVADTEGGKGVNVARALHAAGVPVRAVVAVDGGDPLADLLDASGLPWLAVPAGGGTRVNLALLGPDGTTTKVDAAGPTWPGHSAQEVLDLPAEAGTGDWLVCSGSLPPGAPAGLYADLAVAAAARGLRAAVDTSGAALVAAAACGDVHVLAPNEAELREAARALDGDRAGMRDDLRFAALVADARALLGSVPGSEPRGAERMVLVTCGARGAALVTATEAWWADAPDVPVVSTVGAGDAALAGLVAALERDPEDMPGALDQAVAWGSAAVTVAPGAPPPVSQRPAPGPGDPGR